MGSDGGQGWSDKAEELRVLHVDDEPAIVELTAEYLQAVDDRIDVVSATDAEEALALLAEADVDCVVSDYEMPGMDGIDLLRAVRERDEEIPFVLFTSHGSEAVASDAISAGVDEYLQKEAGREQYELLANRVANLVSRRRAERRAAELARINEVIREVDAALVGASTRSEIERAVCETLSTAEPYSFAWVGVRDRDAVTVRASHPPTDFTEEVSLAVDPERPDLGPLNRAIDTGEVTTCQRVEETEAEWQAVAADYGFRSAAVVPLGHDGVDYGYLAVYADRPEAFDETECDLLEELGDNVAHAIHGTEAAGALEQSRDRTSALFENASDGIVYVEYDEGEPLIRDVNPAFEATFGVDREAVLGENVDDVVAAEEQRPAAADISRRARRGEQVETEVTRVAADGPREFLLQLVPLGAEDGEVERAFAVYTDISDHKRREAELGRINERVSRLHEVAHRLGTADSREEIYDVTITAAVDILAFDWCVLSRPVEGRFELVGVSDDAPFEVGDAPLRTDEGVGARVFETGETDLTDDVLADSDGKPAADAIRSALTIPVGDFGLFQAVSSEVAGFDDNDRELAELLITHVAEALARVDREAELERQNERLERFTSVLSHDLRNPLNVAEGRVDLARTTGDLDHLEDAEAALSRMDTIIEDVLTLARGGDATDPEPVALDAVASTAWSMVDTPETTLVVDADDRVLADRSGLQRLLENLIRNSIEHGDAETVRIEGTPDGFAVADDGRGFGDTDALFESGHSGGDGTGLGLAIVERIAEAHGWTVRAADGDAGARVVVEDVDVVDATTEQD